jgi:hypothetical protein
VTEIDLRGIEVTGICFIQEKTEAQWAEEK